VRPDANWSVLLTGPADPDGDSIGACLALAWALRKHGVADVTVSGTPSARYEWLPGAASMVPNEQVRSSYDVVIVLDGDRHRLHPVIAKVFAGAQARVIIDHHLSTRPVGYELSLIVPEAASTCDLVVALLEDWQLELDQDVATVLYTGLVFDTGGFRHPNTAPATFRLAARLIATGIDHSAISIRVLHERRASGMWLLGKALATATISGELAWSSLRLSDIESAGGVYTDIEGIVDQLLLTEGVELACLFVERTSKRVKLSLRSRARVDVSRLARFLDADGGGHRRAAGVELAATMDDVLVQVPAFLESSL
jgi:phosphoesterase RecJ-like protein